MQALRAGFLYGVSGFAAGFFFGALREMLFIPLLGNRAGHLLEFPLLLAVIFTIAGMMVRRMPIVAPGSALAAGIVGVAILLAIESTFALAVLGQSLQEYLASFNLLKGELFPVGLALMALAPLFFCLRRQRD